MTQPYPLPVETLLDIARDLTARVQFDAAVVLRMLEYLQRLDLDVQSHGAVTHARLAAQSAQSSSNSSRDAIAKFALARVVTVLEAQSRVTASHPPVNTQQLSPF